MPTIDTKAIIWDLDGTILDSLKVQYEVLGLVLKARQMAIPSRELMAKNFHGKLDDTFRAIMPDLDVETLNTILAEFLVMQNPVYASLDTHIYSDALDLMRRAHKVGKTQVIISNRSHAARMNASPHSIASRTPLAGLVEYVVAGDDNEFHKPDARVMGDILKKTGLEPADFVVVGDQYVDAELAHNLGSKSILVAREEEHIPHLERLGDGWQDSVIIVSSLSEVTV